MTRTQWIVGGVVLAAVLVGVIYLASRPSGDSSLTGDGGTSGTAAGIIASIGAGLTGIFSTIAGAVEDEEQGNGNGNGNGT